MPSDHPRTPEVEVSKDAESGFDANIYDGEYLIQIKPHENGYQLSLASKNGMGDAAFLRTYGREERFRELLESEFRGIDEEVVFEVLEEHFDDTEYRIVNLKEGVKTFADPGADLYVETGETIPTLTENRDYRDDQWVKDKTYKLRIWPTEDLWIQVLDDESGDEVADYRPMSLLEDIRNEESDEHDRHRGPTSVPGVHGPVVSQRLENAPVVHTHVECTHLDTLRQTEFVPAGEEPPNVPADGYGELPLRWCFTCRYREPTPKELRQKYGL